MQHLFTWNPEEDIEVREITGRDITGAIFFDSELCDILGSACAVVDRWYRLETYVCRKPDGSLRLWYIRAWTVKNDDLVADFRLPRHWRKE